MPHALTAALLLLAAATSATAPATAYEQIYPPTPAGTIHIKTLPSRTALRATLPVTDVSDASDYFTGENTLFRRLFTHITSNDIAMTVPVEAEINPAAMTFYIGKDQTKNQAENKENKEENKENGITVHPLPPRLVASIGYRGAYTRSRYRHHEQKLRQWLSNQTTYHPMGAPYAVYWDGPFTLWFLKKAEIHIPVQKID